MTRWIMAAALAAASALALGAPAAKVASVQLPAWVQQGAVRHPLQAGMLLNSTDTVESGGGGRVLLQLGEGSHVRLGENSQIRLVQLKPQADGVFAASLDVVKGAFRFTTRAVSKLQRREVTIRVATITAGIRGTDVWGKTTATRDVVCLLEGQIAVSHQDGVQASMDTPNTFFVADRDQPPSPVGAVSAEQIATWAAETHLTSGAGALVAGGKYALELGVFETQADALAQYDILRAAGYPVRLRPVGGRYAVRLSQLASAADAAALATRLQDEFRLSRVRVLRGA
jgi:hypothetical protein